MADVMQYREVRQRFSVRDDDGPDSDLLPDRYTVTGVVEFTPRLPKGDVIAYPEEFVKPMPITGRIVAGELFANWVESDQEEPRPLFLPVTVDDEADQTWSWIMRVSSLSIDGQEADIKMGDREFQVEAGNGPLWLSTVAAVSKGGGTITTRGPRGYAVASVTAGDGQIAFVWEDGTEHSVPMPETAQGVGVEDATQPYAGGVAFRLTDGTTTSPVSLPPGPPGRDGSNVLPTSEAIAQEVADPESRSREVIAQVVGSAPPLPLQGMVVGEPIVYDPCDAWGGYVWGAASGAKRIGRSDDGGETWSDYCEAPFLTGSANTASRILPANDGEVLVVALQGVWRSAGWAAAAPTWTLVQENPTASFFYPWGADGDGTKFIVTHYAAAPNMLESRYVFISTDEGRTWSEVYDTTSRYGEADSAVTHIHSAAYDPWEDRFIVCEGHGPSAGIYESRDNGATWSKLEWGFTGAEGSTPTVSVATDEGIVFGSDAAANGIYVLPRGSQTVEQAWVWGQMTTTSLLGYAHMGYRDPNSGIVYIAYTSYEPDRPAPVAASDGRVAAQVWADPIPARMWRKLVVDHAGRVIMRCQTDSTIARGRTGGRGVPSPTLLDTGRVLGGANTGDRNTVSVGMWASASGTGAFAANNGVAASHGVAIGNSAAAVQGGVAVGSGAMGGTPTGLYGIALGYDAKAYSSGVAIGQQAHASHQRGTAIGPRARSGNTDGTGGGFGTAIGSDSVVESASNGTAIGYGAKALFSRGTAIGALAESRFNDAVAIGEKAVATRQSAVALGGDALADHNQSVALGDGTITNASSQVAVGPRDVEIQDSARGVILRSPNGTAFRVRVGDDGALTTTALSR